MALTKDQEKELNEIAINQVGNTIKNAMYYAYNAFNESESIRLFGDNLGKHIWGKFLGYDYNFLKLYAELDNECRHKLSNAIFEYMNKNK